MRTKAVHTRVFLEGLEVEFNSVQITETRNEPPTASVSFPADSKVLHMLPRTVCHIFWLDDGGSGAGTLDATYRLIFQGEMSGTSITFDESRRDIQLHFLGFTQNWNNNYIQSLDINLPNMMNSVAMGIDYPTKDGKIKWDKKSGSFMASSQFSPLANIGTQLAKADVSLPVALRKLIESFGAEGVYLRSISEAFDIYKQIYIYDSTVIKELTKNQATGGFINSIAANVDSTMPMYEGIMSVLKWIGYECQEIAAPAMVDGNLYRVYVRPQCDFFPPIKCNAVFDDEIQHLTFDRNLESEPTRLISQTYPFQGVHDNQEASLAMAIIVPAGVYVSKEIEEEVKKAKALAGDVTQAEGEKQNEAVPSSDPATVIEQTAPVEKTVTPGSVYYRSLTFDQLKKHISFHESKDNPAIDNAGMNIDKTVDTGLYMINDRHIGFAPANPKTGFPGGNDGSRLQKQIDMLLQSKYGISPDDELKTKREALKNPEANEEIARLVFASQGIDGWATKDLVLASYSQESGLYVVGADSGILALTPEEQCRGVRLAHRENTTGMENSYILHAINTAFDTSYIDMESAYAELGKTADSVVKANKMLDNMYGPPRHPDEKTLQDQKIEHLHSYHTAMALIDFYHQRHKYRTCGVTVPYSPYRLVGLPGIVLTKYFAPIVGTLHSVSSMISADGNATQSLTFTHARIYANDPKVKSNVAEIGELAPEFSPSVAYGFMDDNYPSPPFWYGTFASGDGFITLYKQITGRTDAGLWNPPNVENYNQFSLEARKLYKKYKTSKETGDSNKFIHDTTMRNLPTRKDVSDHWVKGKPRTLLATSARGMDAKPFVKDRIDRVKEVFDYKGTVLGKDIFKDDTFKDGASKG